MSKYIYIEDGYPEVMEKLISFNKLHRSMIANNFNETISVFTEEHEWELRLINTPILSSWELFLAKTIYDPRVPIESEWVATGPFSKEKVIALVKKGLITDDDIIQQYFDGEEVIQLIESAENYSEIYLAVDAICGGHETNSATRKYIVKIIGEKYFEED